MDVHMQVDGDPTLEPGRMLNESEAKKLANAYGVTTPQGCMLSADLSDISDVQGMQGPYVVKIVSSDIVHKSDGGFVALNLNSVGEVEEAARRMSQSAKTLNASVQGFLVEQMIPKGVELVVGGFRDPSFGPLVMVGFGGIFVEVFKDVSFRICPITRLDAEEMIEDLRCKPILEGARGQDAVDFDALYALLLKIGGADGMMLGSSGISELDLNPVIAGKDGVIAVDARVKLI